MLAKQRADRQRRPRGGLPMATKKLMEIDSHVPFDQWIHWMLHETHSENLKTLIHHSDLYERRYLAWEEVRIGRNPYFDTGTGFEGYFVGRCVGAEEALNKVVKVGDEILNNLIRLHRHEHRYQTRLMKTLVGELPDQQAIAEWAAELGAELARLRCNLIRNIEAADFQEETYALVYSLPAIAYEEEPRAIHQHYSLVRRVVDNPTNIVNPQRLIKPSQQDAWLVAQSVGKFGHPLVREALHHAPN
jgi:hypothetical protein